MVRITRKFAWTSDAMMFRLAKEKNNLKMPLQMALIRVCLPKIRKYGWCALYLQRVFIITRKCKTYFRIIILWLLTVYTDIFLSFTLKIHKKQQQRKKTLVCIHVEHAVTLASSTGELLNYFFRKTHFHIFFIFVRIFKWIWLVAFVFTAVSKWNVKKRLWNL